MRFLLIPALLALVASPASRAAEPQSPITVTAPSSVKSALRPIVVTATPIPLDPSDPRHEQVGRLRYLGGLVLTSSDPRFGGLSGMRFTGPLRLLGVGDGGHWLSLQLREADGRLVGVDAAGIAMIRGPQREPLKGKTYVDAEALEIGSDGLAVAFEREHRIWRYDGINSGARATAFPDEQWLAALPGNAGIEAMARVGKGIWLYMAEATTAEGRQEGLLTKTGLARAYAPVEVPTRRGFRPTDVQALDEAHVLILSRRFDPIAGTEVALDIVGVDARRLQLGPVESVAALAGPPLNLDNMEALAVRREGDRTFVYIGSDDNFSSLQRTLLMKFELLP